MAPSLTTLPQELLIKIVTFIDDQPSKCSLIQSSRLLCHPALPHLYRNVAFLQQGKHAEPLEEARCQHHALYAFTLQLLQCPHRASCVKTLTVGAPVRPIAGSADRSGRKICTRTVPNEHPSHDCIRKIIGNLPNFAHKEGWIREIQRFSCIEGLLAVLLPFLPNLEHLTTPLARQTSSSYLTHMLHCAVECSGSFYPSTALGRLRTLTVPSNDRRPLVEDDRHGMQDEQLALWLQIPSLEHISMNMWGKGIRNNPEIGGRTGTDRVWRIKSLQSLPKASSGVTSISLDGGYMRYEQIKGMVGVSQALKSLKLHWPPGSKPRRTFFHIYVFHHAASVVLASSTLETLALTYTLYLGSGPRDRYPRADEEDGPFRLSLTHFPQLRTLKLGMVFIFGPRSRAFNECEMEQQPPGTRADLAQSLSSLLPLSIESLHLVRNQGEEMTPILMNVEALLLQKAEKFTCLGSITIKDQLVSHEPKLTSHELLGSYESPDALVALRDLATAVDVQFRAVLCEPAPGFDANDLRCAER